MKLTDFEDFLWDALLNSMDVDWTSATGAKAIIYEMDRAGVLPAVLVAMGSDKDLAA